MGDPQWTPAVQQEKDIGIGFFATASPGIGGKLRTMPEDFIVDEVPILPPRDDNGPYAIIQVKAENWENNRLLHYMAGALKIARERISFAGTKDKRAITTQFYSIKTDEESVKSINIPHLKIKYMYQSNDPLKLGHLHGNNFWIRIKDTVIKGVELDSTLTSITEVLENLNGFPNYFGVQRFGSLRPITHTIGEYLVKGDIEGAVMRYIGQSTPKEDPNIQRIRNQVYRSKDFASALEEYPSELYFEKKMLKHLADRPEDFIGALRSLPRNLQMMFVHAYQSYMFNIILSKRIEQGLSLQKPEVGDVVLPLDDHGNVDNNRPMMVKEYNQNTMEKRCLERKAVITGTLFGTQVELSEGPMGEIEQKLFKTEKIDRDNFNIIALPDLSSRGWRRGLLCSFYNFDVKREEENQAVLRFRLPKGSYATCLLREFMKSHDLLNY